MNNNGKHISVRAQFRIGVIVVAVIAFLAASTALFGYVYIDRLQNNTLSQQSTQLNNIEHFFASSRSIRELAAKLVTVKTEAELLAFELERDAFLKSLSDSQLLKESSSDIGVDSKYIDKLEVLFEAAFYNLRRSTSYTASAIESLEEHRNKIASVFSLTEIVKEYLRVQVLEVNLEFYALTRSESSLNIAPEKLRYVYERKQRLGELVALMTRLGEELSQLEHIDSIENVESLSNSFSMGVREFATVASQTSENSDLIAYSRRLHDVVNEKNSVFNTQKTRLLTKQGRDSNLEMLQSISVEIESISDAYRGAVTSSAAHTSNDLRQKTSYTLGSIALGLIISLIGSGMYFRRLVNRGLIEPLVDMTEATKQLSYGDLDVEIHEYDSLEMKNMAFALNVLRVKSALLEQAKLEMQEANKELNDLSYATQHYLKAPLRGIADLTNFLKEDLAGQLDPESEDNLNKIERRVMRFQNLLSELAEYSGVEHQADKPTEIHFVQYVREKYNTLAQDSGFSLSLDTDVEKIYTEEAPLKHILDHLIDNSLKHHDRATGLIKVGLAEDRRFYTIYVEDDGPGIDPKYHEKIFKIFQTLKPNDQTERSGMGLAVVSRILEHRSCEISVISDPAQGRGSKFEFKLPKKKFFFG